MNLIHSQPQRQTASCTAVGRDRACLLQNCGQAYTRSSCWLDSGYSRETAPLSSEDFLFGLAPRGGMIIIYGVQGRNSISATRREKFTLESADIFIADMVLSDMTDG
jgi:hypothetical protein